MLNDSCDILIEQVKGFYKVRNLKGRTLPILLASPLMLSRSGNDFYVAFTEDHFIQSGKLY